VSAKVEDGSRPTVERAQLLALINANLPGTCVYRTVLHRDGRFECLYVSPNVEALIGASADEFMTDASRVFARIHPDDREMFRRSLVEAVARGGAMELTARVRRTDGREVWAQFRSRLTEVRADGAQVRDGVVVDITSVKAADAELRAVRQRLEMALGAASTCIWDDDLATNRIVLDPLWSQMRGYPPAETVTSWRRLIAVAHPDDRAAIMRETRRAVFGETDEYRIEQRVATADGGWIWIMSHGRVVARDAQGRAARIIGTNTDITARKRAEEQVRQLNADLERLVAERTAALEARTAELAKSERLFRNLIEDINQGYFVANPRSLFTYCSPTVEAYAGAKAKQLLGKSVFRVVAPEDRPRVIAAYGNWIRDGAAVGKIEFRLAAPSEKVIWAEQTSVFVRDAAGRLVEIRNSVRNVTERKLAELALLAEQGRTAIFAQLGRELADAETPKAAAARVLEAAQKLLGWDSAWLHLWNEPQRKFDDVADFDTIDGELREVAPNVAALWEPSPTARRVMTEGPQMILRESAEEAGDAAGPLFGSARRSLSLLFVPIRIGPRFVGIVSIQSYRHRAYGPAGLEVLHSLATHCASALVRQQDAAALRLSSERFQAVFERSPIVIGLLSVPEGRLVEFNAAGVAAFGYARSEALGRTSVELNLWEDPAVRDHYLRELRAKGHVEAFEARMRRKNGEIFTVIYSGSVVEISGQIYSLNSLQDISVRRQAETALRASEERLSFALEATNDGLWDWDIGSGAVYFSPQWGRLLGYGPGEVPARVEFFFERLHPEDGPVVRQAVADHLEGRTSIKQSEVRLKTKAGDYRWFLDRGKIVARDAEGKPTRMVGTITDITARKRAEETIAHSVASLRATLESTADGILTVGADRRIESFNRPFADMWRIPPALLAGGDDERLLAFVLEQLREPARFIEKVEHLYRHPREESFDQFDFKDGRVFERVSRPMLVDGEAAGRVWSFRDITERYRIRLRLAAFAKLGRLLNASHEDHAAGRIIAGMADELFGWDAVTLHRYDAGRDACRSILNMDLVGGRRTEVPPSSPERAPTPRMRRAIDRGGELILRAEPFLPEPGALLFGDTARPSASLMIVPLREGARVVGVFSIQSYRSQAYTAGDLEALQAMADHCAGALVRIQTIDALAASEERLRLVWDSATDGMRLTDGSGRVIAVNDAFGRLVGKTRGESEGRSLAEAYIEADRERVLNRYRERFAARDVSASREHQVTLWDGRVVLLDVSSCFIETDPGCPLMLGVFRDITERRRAETEREKLQTRLFQKQKFEALGTLAGGVAHDFNNILAGMLNYTALAQSECPPSHPEVRAYLGEVLKGGHRAKELVRQILLLSRSEGAAREPLQLALVVREALSLLRATIPAAVEIKSDVDPRAPLVLAEATQIHQVVMNLGINASRAMKAQGGTLTVKLRARELDAAQAAELVELKAGPHVCLTVEDTGCGMEPAVVARIFEPFFTTRSVGDGSGLGLAVVQSVVRGHRGAIAVRTRPGEGATFEVFFPAVVAPEPAARPANEAMPRGAGQRILLVDDEKMVARSLQLVMTRLGYAVTACNHPDEALARFEAAPGDFDLVITDFQMPGMNGVALAMRLLARRPELAVYVASGFAGDLTDEKIRALGLRGLMRKPIEMAELAELLARTFAR
jgi:PAS domain S-box-containing protein